MKQFRGTILIILGLLLLLGVLAVLQYRWMSQIAANEREQTQRRLEADIKRFSDEFNSQIHSAAIFFQLDADQWKKNDGAEFAGRYAMWRDKTEMPELLEDFYFLPFDEERIATKFNRETGKFERSAPPENIVSFLNSQNEKTRIQPFEPKIPALIIPIVELGMRAERFVVKKDDAPPVLSQPKRAGILLIALNRATITEKILPDLSSKFFGDNSYAVAVADREKNSVFQTASVENADASGNLLDPLPGNFVFIGNRQVPPIPENGGKIVMSRVETRTSLLTETTANVTEQRVKVTPGEGEKRMKIEVHSVENGEKIPLPTAENGWTVSVQHKAGSIEKFINGNFYKNLFISYGILALLGVSVLLIVLSTQRARNYAQRQIDFVSSVSHEFRTPLAVIYSAGENLADGVARDNSQVARYGDLIKSEGKKLSGMVEQILDFAGANAGKRVYDLQPRSVGEVVTESVNAVQPQIDGANFTVDLNVEKDLPLINIDFPAVCGALQNLIVNAVKYSNGSRRIGISALRVGVKVQISVEDSGIGIKSDDLKKIFEPFYRAKSVVDSQIHGNGLGLSLVKRTMKAHGGEVFAESALGTGSKFTLEFPVMR